MFEKPSFPSGFNLKLTCGLRGIVPSLFGKVRNKMILGDTIGDTKIEFRCYLK
jgi:hypothetical protein